MKLYNFSEKDIVGSLVDKVREVSCVNLYGSTWYTVDCHMDEQEVGGAGICFCNVTLYQT